MGKLIVIEGLDASGKETQSNKLYERLINEGVNVKKVEFPDYNSDSSSMIKMYLSGEFGKDAFDVNAIVASTFYTVDRYASYKTKWKNFYNNGGVVISDRYTTSNMIHQASKYTSDKEKIEFLNWLTDFEYNKFELPKPDCVIYLHMNTNNIHKLMENRKNKYSGEDKKDVHESNKLYLEKCYESAMFSSDYCGWKLVECCNDNGLRSIEDIHNEIYNIVKNII